MRFRQFLIPISIFCICLLVWNVLSTKKTPTKKQLAQDRFIMNDEEPGERMTDFLGAAKYEFDMIKDPNGQVPAGIHQQELQQATNILARQSSFRTLANTYSFAGPGNLGGRTRSILFDANFSSNQVVYAGGVSGGLYKSIDNATTWVRKSPVNQLYSVTSIAQDTRAGKEDTLYYSTGEPIGNSTSATLASYSGNGVYKSINRGETWARLPASNPGSPEAFDRAEDFITKLVVNPMNGDVYMACISTIRRSQDGGVTWATVLNGTVSNTTQLTDIIVTSTGRLYAAFAGANTNTVDGVWTSTTGDLSDWTRIAGTGVAINPAGWNAAGAYGRVVLAATPQKDTVYALYYNNLTSTCPGGVAEAELYRYDLSANGWTDLSANLPDEVGCSVGNDPFAVQGGYDLVIEVKPDEDSVLYIGGTNIYRSKNGFSDATKTIRIGGYATPASFAQYPNSHPDIHSISFQPNNPIIMLCGNDGGIQRTLNDTATVVSWSQANTDYRTFQYYYVTVDPRSGNDKILGGAQDNGTSRNTGVGTDFELVRSGDGVSVGLSNVISTNTYEYCGVQNGVINRRSPASAFDARTDIRPTTATNNGIFVTLFHLDPDNTETLYYANDSSLYRTVSASTVTTAVSIGSWTLFSNVGPTIGSGVNAKISALATTRGVYNPVTASLFIGTNNGLVYRIDDPVNAASTVTPLNISGAGFPPTGNVRSISVNPRNDDTILVTFSNYGVASLWWTGNANAATPTWQNVEGNLTLPSVRSSAIAVTNAGVEYFVGTSVGLFRTTINGAAPGSTSWTQEGMTDLGNAVVNSLALRPSDNVLVVGTHGYGIWRTILPLAALPLQFISFSGKAEQNYNRLFWATGNEIDNKGFELERKYESDNDFFPIGFTNALNNGGGVNSYSFEDRLVDLGKENASYRIRQIDIDGKISYSKVITLNRRVAGKLIEYVSSFANQLFIRVNNGSTAEIMRVQLLDASGRLVKTFNVSRTTQVIDLSGVASGVYVVSITNQHGLRFSQQVFR